LKDLETVDKVVSKVHRQATTGADKEAKRIYDVMSGLKAHLEQGKSARSFETDKDGQDTINEYQLLTSKPILYVCNVDDKSVVSGNQHTRAVMEAVKHENAEVLLVSASAEADIAELESYEDRQMFLEEMGLTESGVTRLIQKSYSLLNLITYFTAGVKEVRAWTITNGTKAPQAAAVIHTDFEKGFIRAEVIHYADFVKYGSESACRDNGKLGVEGKEYLVQDGDVMHFRFNV
jgi:GTP-binding protein YchF